MRFGLFILLASVLLASNAYAISETVITGIEPVVYLNFNEGSGNYAFDVSGHGSSGILHGVNRVDNGGCGRGFLFNGIDSYVDIPFSSQNHPDKEITVSLWFFTDSFHPQVLISSYEGGGYRLGFDDGQDLWWTINLEGVGDISLPVQHEGIAPRQWHHVTGTYDGQTSRIYLDGILRNQVNASGKIHYQNNNYVIVGADAGTNNVPNQDCPKYFRGELDEVRIYNRALTYSQVIDDRYRCAQELVLPSLATTTALTKIPDSCDSVSGALQIPDGQSVTRVLRFDNQTEHGIWNITIPAGSTLVVKAMDAYPKAYPDSWYIEIDEGNNRTARSVAFPTTYNTPTEGVVASGNATVRVLYFDGSARFPSHVRIQFTSIEAKKPPEIPQNIFSNPIIVIYSASWATLIALILVMLWLHKRKNK